MQQNSEMIEFKILTQRVKGESHHETKVFIDWTGVTREELLILAKNAIVHDLQARYVKSDKKPPEVEVVNAREQVHLPPVALIKYQPPPPKVDRTLENLLKQLSPEDLAELLK